MAKTFGAHYSTLSCARMMWRKNCLVLVPHADSAGRYCLNKQACHSSSSVYFVFYITNRNVPTVYPGCFCSKQEAFDAHNLTCRDFYNSKKQELVKPIPFEKAKVIFAPYYEAVAARQLPGEESAASDHETIEDLLIRHASNRKRRVGVGSRAIITVQERRRISRQTDEIEQASMHTFS